MFTRVHRVLRPVTTVVVVVVVVVSDESRDPGCRERDDVVGSAVGAV